MARLYNLARMTTATTGTGSPLTLGSAVSGWLTFALAGVQDGETVSYGIRDGAHSEVGRGVYTASGTTLTRSVLKSTNSDSAISLSGNAEVFITALAEDFAGSVVQTVIAERTTVGTTSSTSIPFDDTIPQSGEGTEFLTCAITPKNAANKLRVDVNIPVAINSLSNAIAALFRDAGADAIAAGLTVIPASGYVYHISFSVIVNASSTSETTFKLRAAPSNSSHVMTVNGSGGTRFGGGALRTTITVTELRP